MPEFHNKTSYWIVPAFHYNKPTVTIPGDRVADLEYIMVEPHQAMTTSYASQRYARVSITRIKGDGSLEEIKTSVTKGRGAYMGEYEADSDNYFHLLSCILNGNAKKLTEKQFKAERIRRV